jgi:hypothetical protein
MLAGVIEAHLTMAFDRLRSCSIDLLDLPTHRNKRGDRVARMTGGAAVPPIPFGFMRSGHRFGRPNSSILFRAAAAMATLVARIGQSEIEAHRRLRVCIDRSTSRPWPEDCSHWIFASPCDRVQRAFGGEGPAGVGTVSAEALGTAVVRGGTMTAASGSCSATAS